MGQRLGSGYLGSTGLLTSIANAQILPTPPSNWTRKYYFYKFAFMNDQECRIILNDSNQQIYLRAGQGFEMNEIDNPIWSFKIVESGVTYNWMGAY